MATTTSNPAALSTWKLDPAHSSAEFKVKHMMISNVKGSFHSLSGTLTEHPTDKTLSSIDATIDVSSITTCNAERDAHLKSADFLDVARYPAMTFSSSKVQPNGDSGYYVTGDLTIHGETHQQTFVVEGPTAPGKDPSGNTRIGLSATTRINRKDYGLSWNAALETGGILVGDDVNITIEAQFLKT
ncbi:YceI family protein [Occallatibacter riparius]|uniref:YceI family protein n=1 Tax=Occallatibacter riparius TaxID=1002689 RepID=A0A9J7BQV4_9BACT|nr:YceI family protein [Occallatibacter riparius]UWZ85203.1 YceI family protein [Occallatibacter riparius]